MTAFANAARAIAAHAAAGSDCKRGDVMRGESAVSGSTAVVLQHRSDAPAGLLTDVLAEAGFRPRTIRIDLGEPLPDPAGFELAVSLGESTAREAAASEIEWLRMADRAGVAVLALGTGAQSLAVALGGEVHRVPKSRQGWVWLWSAMPGWIASGPWLAWRDETIRLPSGAKLLAHDARGPQVFGAGRHLGVQFHPEVTPGIVADWVRSARDESLDAQGLLEVTSREFAAASVAARRLLSTYIHSVARSAA
jgi:GMP synthase-like glutamine amidotransferase